MNRTAKISTDAAATSAASQALYAKPAKLSVAVSRVLLTIFITAAVFLALKVIEEWFISDCDPSDEMSDESCQQTRRTNTIATAILTFARTVAIVVGLLFVLHHTGIRTTTLFTLAGIFSLVVGLAAQNVLKDFFAGLVFLAEEQMLNGDYVHLIVTGVTGDGICSGISGIVESVSMRKVKLRNFENETIYIPNGTIQAVVNSSQNYPVVRLRVQVSRTANLTQVIDTITQACLDLSKDEDFVINYPKPTNEKTRLRILRTLETVGMDSPDPVVAGVSDMKGECYDILVRFMVDVGRQWQATRYVRGKIISALQDNIPDGAHGVTVVRLTNTGSSGT
jgi:small-conductance mechanosensitive channel